MGRALRGLRVLRSTDMQRRGRTAEIRGLRRNAGAIPLVGKVETLKGASMETTACPHTAVAKAVPAAAPVLQASAATERTHHSRARGPAQTRSGSSMASLGSPRAEQLAKPARPDKAVAAVAV